MGALGVALTAHALVGGPRGVWKVHASAGELGLLFLFFAAYSAVCYDAATKSEPLVGATLILLVGGVLPASIGSVHDETKPMFPRNGVLTQARWTMDSLARVGLVVSTLLTLAFELVWYEVTPGTHHLTGIVSGACLVGFAGMVAIYGMPLTAASAEAATAARASDDAVAQIEAKPAGFQSKVYF